MPDRQAGLNRFGIVDNRPTRTRGWAQNNWWEVVEHIRLQVSQRGDSPKYIVVDLKDENEQLFLEKYVPECLSPFAHISSVRSCQSLSLICCDFVLTSDSNFIPFILSISSCSIRFIPFCNSASQSKRRCVDQHEIFEQSTLNKPHDRQMVTWSCLHFVTC